MHFSAKCNSGCIAIQWFHITHYLDNQYTKFQPYTFSGAKNVCFCTIGNFGSQTTIRLYNFKCEYYIALQFYLKTSKVISNVFDYISKLIVIVISTFLQVL